MKDLKDIGFEQVGRWYLSGAGLRLSLERLIDAAPALYIFVFRDEVVYVGKTKRTLNDGLDGHLKVSGKQRTNVCVRGKILEALQQEESLFRSSDQGRRQDQLLRSAMTRQTAIKMIKRCAREASLTDDIFNHGFRGTDITEYLRNGGDWKSLHASPAKNRPAPRDCTIVSKAN